MGADPVQRAVGHVMSCAVRIVVVDGSSAATGMALRRLADLEQRWSRFLPDSELSRLNRADGAPVAVSSDTVRLVRALVQAWHATDGAFDPTLLVPLVGLGYSVSRDDAGRRTSVAAGSAPRGRPAEILIDDVRSTVQLPSGTVLDAGGLGKGLAADIVVEELLAEGTAGALVEVGGDLRVAGISPGGDGWLVAIEPVPGGPTEMVRLASGGVATSSSLRRTWQRGERVVHHLLDPASLDSTATDVIGATVIAGTAQWAEAFTKAPFVLGATAGLDLMAGRGIAASVVTADGGVCRTAPWSDYSLEPLSSGAHR